jgi:hypothetical protein
MSTQTLDYTAILHDLEAKKSTIEAAIASIRSLLLQGIAGRDDQSLKGIAPSLAGQSIPEAAKAYLKMVGKPQSSREIAKALRDGGIQSTSSDFEATVHAGLIRASKLPNSPIVNLGGRQWGLRNGDAATMTSPAKQTQKGREKQKVVVRSSDLVLQFLRSRLGVEQSIQEVAKHTGLTRQAVCGAIQALNHIEGFEKTSSGNLLLKGDATPPTWPNALKA